MVAVGVNCWAGHVHPGQSPGNRVDAGLLKHFSDGTVRWVFAGFHNAGDRSPGAIIGAFDEEHLLTANDHSGYTWQPQRRVPDVPAELNDEIGNRHTHCLTDAENVLRAMDALGNRISVGDAGAAAVTGRHVTRLPTLSLVQQTLRVDTAGVQAMATRWGASAGDLNAAAPSAELGLSCQPSTAAVNTAHADITAVAAALAARVDARATHVAEADTLYIVNETHSADQLAAVAHPVTDV